VVPLTFGGLGGPVIGTARLRPDGTTTGTIK
jgi:hypothetical protein